MKHHLQLKLVKMELLAIPVLDHNFTVQLQRTNVWGSDILAWMMKHHLQLKLVKMEFLAILLLDYNFTVQLQHTSQDSKEPGVSVWWHKHVSPPFLRFRTTWWWVNDDKILIYGLWRFQDSRWNHTSCSPKTSPFCFSLVSCQPPTNLLRLSQLSRSSWRHTSSAST